MAATNNPVEIVNIDFFASWKYRTNHSECQICRENFESPCIDCISSQKNKIICHVTQGKCGHCFHKHCIEQWTKTSSICPICKTPYETEIDNMANKDSWQRLLKQ